MERAINPIATALSPLFKPLIDSLEVELSGLLANPQWRFSVHPSNIFESPTFSPRPIGPLDGEEDEESQDGGRRPVSLKTAVRLLRQYYEQKYA